MTPTLNLKTFLVFGLLVFGFADAKAGDCIYTDANGSSTYTYCPDDTPAAAPPSASTNSGQSSGSKTSTASRPSTPRRSAPAAVANTGNCASGTFNSDKTMFCVGGDWTAVNNGTSKASANDPCADGSMDADMCALNRNGGAAGTSTPASTAAQSHSLAQQGPDVCSAYENDNESYAKCISNVMSGGAVNNNTNSPATTSATTPCTIGDRDSSGNICNSDGKFVTGPGGGSTAAAPDACVTAVNQAGTVCKAGGAVGLAQQAAGLASMANASSANAGAACTMASKIADAQALFSTGVAAACEYEIHSCNNACDPAQAGTDTAKKANYVKYQSMCDANHMLAAQSGLQAAGDLLSAQGAKDCAKAYNAATVAATPVLAETCAANPNYAATHTLECYCATNPSDAKCVNPALALNASGLAQPSLAGISGKSTYNGDPNTAGNGAPTAPATGTAPTNAASPSSGGGGGFGGGGPAQAALAAAPEDPGAAAGSGNGGNIFGGFSAGQGGFSYGKGAGSGETGGLAGAVKNLATKLNLNNLVPKRNDYVNRSVAGMTVSAKDGVTGPNGPSIWEKVSRRYQIKKGDLLPP